MCIIRISCFELASFFWVKEKYPGLQFILFDYLGNLG